MAVENPSVNLNDVLTKSGVSTGTKKTTTEPVDKNALGKDAFLKLLVTQMQHQNPLDPQDNGQFIAQLAQFSSLEGIQTLNSSVNSIISGMGSSQALQASSLVGRSVIVQNDKALFDPKESLNGQVVVPQNITDGKVTIKDKDGNVVKTIQLGEQKKGTADFIWDGTNDKGEKVEAGTYTFTATTTVDGKSQEMYTMLPAKVTSVSFQNGGEMMLNLAGIGKLGISKVQTIGI
ncbi:MULTISPECIES: flagellar hook assembly protein FlgD [Pseudomonas]|uniref:Basal-body rod modification protein FlgD n=1 Tax=Pseudomonas peradeniyensis TaxID=2745488 RepID=A0A923GDT7_9PSED|nr:MULTISPECIES: flagellar hook assembly protein FlgD [Pseudomonas]MDC0690550.1 flagellar hook assembly protein FlgD [Mitsuaria sp. RG]MBV4508110.1 flagellar hook assembly protein FlgD [Pseudomonas peradeniyensis]MCE0917996.1 flagellar hook assembly protein FlgD [Pseudomonas sp. NMI760_13]MCP8635875.1 flagellar hook assembly protein FlgD [Pseudomonas sp. DVZ6]MDD7786418.1 flagellar hook assembly protein FlgD [Pseudomonas sp. DVZ24]